LHGARRWNESMKRIDANIILRYLLDDHEELSAKAVEIIDYENVFASTEVICEVVYVLCGVYKVARKEVCIRLAEFIRLEHISVSDTDVMLRALAVFAEKNIDFVDSILFAYHAERGDQVVTFDKKLARLIDG
jgi:predicted nucleic-acid-binding protein